MPARRYAVIGLGLMGSRIAARLAALGHPVAGWNRSRHADLAVRCPGVLLADSPAAAVKGAEAVLILLQDGAAVRDVMGGTDLVAGLAPGASVVDMGTNDPGTARDLAARLAGRAAFADAPVSGGTAGAEQGSLSIFLGAPEALEGRLRPLLAPLGRITGFGAVGRGQAAKLANQIAVACNIAGLAEALAFAQHLGLPMQRVLDAMAGGLGDSRVMDLVGPRMVAGDFAPRGRASTHLKDLDAVLGAVPDGAAGLPATAAARALLLALGDRRGDLDHGAMFLAAQAALADRQAERDGAGQKT